MSDDVSIKFGADIASLVSSMNEMASKMETAMKKMEESSTKSSEKVSKSMKGMEIAMMALGPAMAALTAALSVGKIFEVASEFEQLEIRLKAVMGSARDAEEAFSYIKQFARDTPYDVKQTTDAFMTLKNFGLDPMDGTLRKVADASAKFGADMETVNRVSLALGQAWARGKLQGEEMMQMVDAGVPVLDLMSKALGKSASEIQDMAQKGELGKESIRLLIDEMGKVSEGAAHARVDTLAGSVSALGDSINGVIDDIRRSGGFDFIKDSIFWLAEAIPKFADAIAQVFKSIEYFFAATSEAVMVATEDIKNIINQTVSYVVAAGNVFKAVFNGEGFEGASAAWEKEMVNRSRIALEHAKTVSNINKTMQEEYSRLFRSGDSAGKIAEHKVRPLTPEELRVGRSGGGGGAASFSAEELLRVKNVEMIEANHRTMTKAEQHKFIQEQLEIAKEGSKKKLALLKKEQELRIAMILEAKKTEEELTAMEIDRHKNKMLSDIQMEEITVKTAVDLKRMTRLQELQFIADFEARKNQIELNAQRARIDMYSKDPNMSPVALQKLKDELLIIEEKYEMKKAQMEHDVIVAQNEELKKKNEEMQNMSDTMAKGVQDSFEKFLMNPFKGGLQGMLQSFEQMLMQMAAKAAAQKIMDSLFSTTGSGGGAAGLSNIFSDIFGGFFANGGSVSSGKMYQVGEGNKPEIFRSGGKQFMIPGDAGQVIPNQDLQGGGGEPTVTNNMSITVNTQSGNPEEIRRSVGQAGREILGALSSAQRYK